MLAGMPTVLGGLDPKCSKTGVSAILSVSVITSIT